MKRGDLVTLNTHTSWHLGSESQVFLVIDTFNSVKMKRPMCKVLDHHGNLRTYFQRHVKKL